MKNQNYKEALNQPIFKTISEATDELGVDSYVIGGFVRDYLLQRNIPKDIDVVAIGSGIDLAKQVAAKLPGKPTVQVFKNFGTAMIKTADLEIEFVGARKESYDRGSRKPAVENGTLEDDQLRRDFTVNAMAFSLNKRNFGDLLDPFSGIA
ncbi:MAG: tRNA nucleotidyltransferase, partial [Flavobacteriaceae bacterium]|nr:tRNA nucleotidyltransferase [Flavobacteriaceae bacterium]